MTHPDRILAVDIGNTRAKFGCFERASSALPVATDIVARVVTAGGELVDQLEDWWSKQSSVAPQEAVIAGSDPETRDQLIRRWPFVIRPQVICRFDQLPIDVDVQFPERVGIDRLLNVFAASRLQSDGTPVIAVDSGTATTVDLMTGDRVFRGGSILPGLRLSAHAMHDYTARLPLINVDEDPAELPALPGRNTEEAMRAGLFIGQLGAVRELITRLTDVLRIRFDEQRQPAIVVSGGGGRQLVQHLSGAEFIDSLALHGLAYLSRPI